MFEEDMEQLSESNMHLSQVMSKVGDTEEYVWMRMK